MANPRRNKYNEINNIITKSICFCFLPAILKPVYLFAQSDLQEIDPEINITLDGKKLAFISLNEPFGGRTHDMNHKKFPQPWIGLQIFQMKYGLKAKLTWKCA